MKLLCMLAFAFLVLNVESALLGVAGAMLVKVDVGLAVIAYFAMRSMPLEGAIGAFFVGYFQDLLCGHPTGLYPFLAVLVFVLARVSVAAVEVRGAAGFSVVAGLLSLGHNVFAYLMTLVTEGENETHSVAILTAALPTALLTLAVSPGVFLVMKKIESRFTREEHGLLL